MGIFFWKDNKAIDEFAVAIAEDFYNAIPPQAIEKYNITNSKDKSGKKMDKVMQRTLNNLIVKINNFKSLAKIGVYGKARLHMQFKTRLEELGYKKDAIEDINTYIMLQTP